MSSVLEVEVKEVEEKQKRTQGQPEEQTQGPAEDVFAGSDLTKDSRNNDLSAIGLTGNSLTMAMHSGWGIVSPFTREIFLKERLPIVGMRFQGGSLDLIRDIQLGSRIMLMREPENKYDEKAIMALDGQGRKLGYISRYENDVLSALMDAGKTLYGIVSHIPAPGELRPSSTPTVLYVDLYMREFAAPDDMSKIPLQGYKGSYVVLDLELTEEEEDAKIRSVFAIRVINGEERGTYFEELPDTEDEDRAENTIEKGLSDRSILNHERMIQTLFRVIGYLPVVICDKIGRQQETLENEWGIYTGRPFSNQVIEICEMARNHLPEITNPSLERIKERLGIETEGDSKAEMRCRQIWEIYCRLDRSELEKSRNPIPGARHRKKYKVTLDMPVSDLRMTHDLMVLLISKGIDFLWEASILTWQEASERFGRDHVDELEDLLYAAGTTFKPDDDNSLIYGYSKHAYSIVNEKGPAWKIKLFVDMYRTRYRLQQKYRNQRILLSEDLSIEKDSTLDTFTVELLKIISEELEQLHEIYKRLNIAIQSVDDEECIKEMCGAIDDLFREYKQIIIVSQNVQRVGAEDKYRKRLEAIKELVEQLCISAMDEMLKNCDDAEKTVDEYLAGIASGDNKQALTSIIIETDMDGLMQKAHEFEQKIRFGKL